jgi:thymidylate synthase (FAD)
LSGNLETKFVVTGNMRAWRDVLKKRYSTHADAEIRQFAEGVLELLRKEAPNIFQDFPYTPFE